MLGTTWKTHSRLLMRSSLRRLCQFVSNSETRLGIKMRVWKMSPKWLWGTAYNVKPQCSFKHQSRAEVGARSMRGHMTITRVYIHVRSWPPSLGGQRSVSVPRSYHLWITLLASSLWIYPSHPYYSSSCYLYSTKATFSQGLSLMRQSVASIFISLYLSLQFSITYDPFVLKYWLTQI